MNVSLLNSDCHSYNDGNNRCQQSFPGWSNTKGSDENSLGDDEDGWEDLERWIKPPTPGGGVRVPKYKLKRPQDWNNWRHQVHPRKNPCHFSIHSTEELDTGNRNGPNNNSGYWHRQEYNPTHSIAGTRESLWSYPHPKREEIGSDVFSSTSPTHKSSISSNKLESFLSLLPWGKYLLTPEKPKNRPLQPVPEASFRYSTLMSDILGGTEELPPKSHGDVDGCTW